MGAEVHSLGRLGSAECSSYCRSIWHRSRSSSSSSCCCCARRPLPKLNGCSSVEAGNRLRSEKAAIAIQAPSRHRPPGGQLIDDDLVFRQTFVIRSYEVGFDRLASIETLTNLFQETALNHVGMSDFVGDGLGTTHGMMRHGLIWVVTRMHIQAERYPVWGDVVEIDSWINGCGKNFIRRDFHVRDNATGETLCTATSTWAMMNKVTRKLSKIPSDVHSEISPYYLDRHVMDEDEAKIAKVEEEGGGTFVRRNLVPKLHDMDMNQHVNNVKYIGWVLESIPEALLVAHELASMTLEYRRECAASDVVTSMSAASVDGAMLQPRHVDISRPLICGDLRFTHLLRMQPSGSEILRGQTVWRLKQRFKA